MSLPHGPSAEALGYFQALLQIAFSWERRTNFSSSPRPMKTAALATIDLSSKSIVGFSKAQMPTVTAKSAVTVATQKPQFHWIFTRTTFDWHTITGGGMK
jgi:hypothetical protein